MQLPVELFLALRYLRPRRTFVSVITVLSFLGVAISVLVLIVVLSVMAGFRQALDDKIIGFNAHLTVAAENDVIYNYQDAIDRIKQDPAVLAAEPFVRGPVLIRFHHEGRTDAKMIPAYIKSVPVDGDDPVLPMKKFMKMGEYELRGDSALVGTEFSRRAAAFPGDKLEIYGPKFLDSIHDSAAANRAIPLPDEVTIQGVFQTGQFDYDLNFILVSTELAQHIYGMTATDSVEGIAVRLKDPSQAELVKERLNRTLPPPLVARTWMDDNHDLFNAIATEKVVMTFILLMVMLVAGLGLCSTLITITVQKSREIGLMKALGATDVQVCRVFLYHSIVVGVVGAVSGTALSAVVLHYRNPFRDLLRTLFHIEVFPGSVYGLPDIPAVVSPTAVISIAISAVVICMLAALLPALNAARLSPARALRYE
jgi:lipoprotein-releasing system permease protein